MPFCEIAFIALADNLAETASVTAAKLDNLTSVAALVDEAFVQADGAGLAARTILVAIESSDVAGKFGLYTYTQGSATDTTIGADEFTHVATVTGDAIVATDFVYI